MSTLASSVPHVVVIGGGFSGTLTAIQLARVSRAPLRVTVVNSGSTVGRGVAYSATRMEHLLNVPAKNMSAFPDQPTHFVDWLRTNHAADDQVAGQFMPRKIYGDYISSLLREYTNKESASTDAGTASSSLVSIELVHGEAVDIATGTDASNEVHLADGRRMPADKVVLATGNEKPADLPGSDAPAVVNHRGWCANPWDASAWVSKLPAADSGASVVLLGTGLTTVDAIITLLALDWRGPIHAVSRHGLLPLSHFKVPPADDPAFPPAGVDFASLGLDQLSALVETHCARVTAAGVSPATLVDKLRPHTQAVWRSFTVAEKLQFVKQYSARWSILRHRIASSLHEQIESALASGRLTVSSGMIAHVDVRDESTLTVDVRDRKTGEALPQLTAAVALNCTGPHTRFTYTTSVLLQNLLKRGRLQPDEIDMGVRVKDSFAIIPSDESATASIYTMGPLLRGTLWETIAVPELRHQALHVANSIVADLAAEAAARK